MAQTYYIEVVTADRVFYTGHVDMVIIPSIDGSMGILAGHEPMVAAISIGELKLKINGQWKSAAISGGFVEIMPHYAIILTDSCEWPEEIDSRRAQDAIERAEERLLNARNRQEFILNQMAVNRALARLKVVKDLDK